MIGWTNSFLSLSINNFDFNAQFYDFFNDDEVGFYKNENDLIEAKKLDNILQPVHDAMFVESNPSPVKFGAKLMNLCDDEVRLPLVKVTDGAKTIIKKALESAKLI